MMAVVHTSGYSGIQVKHRRDINLKHSFFKLAADWVLVFDWIAGSTQVNSPKHKRGFIFRALSVSRRGYTAVLRQL